jgi:hypothetical protein
VPRVRFTASKKRLEGRTFKLPCLTSIAAQWVVKVTEVRRYRVLWADKVPRLYNRRVVRKRGMFMYEHDAYGATQRAPTSQFMTDVDHFWPFSC